MTYGSIDYSLDAEPRNVARLLERKASLSRDASGRLHSNR
jgi:hypothetical protein